MDELKLSGLKFFGHHGCTEEERKIGQTITVDAVLCLDLAPSGRTDDLKATVDYVEAYEDIRAAVEGESANLIESVAERAASNLLNRHPSVGRVHITLTKPMANITSADSAVSVTIRRTRSK